ncbi:MAG: magnesium/cobalt transporter CorA [Acidobacteria bacterium]|nr:magnesium/cobalt transporter CorA [Acidobacteriota bacterium]
MLVNCVAYKAGRKVADIPIGAIREYLTDPECFVWIALMDPDSTELTTLQTEFDWHELAVEDAHHGHQRPKIEEYDGSLFVVLHMIEAQDRELRVGEVALFVGPQYIVSVRRNAGRGFAEVRRRCEQEPDLLRHGPGYVMYELMDTVVDRYFPLIDELTREIEEIEERVFAGETTRAQIEALYTYKQRLMVLDHAIAPLLEVTARLHGGRVPPMCAGLQNYFRDVYDHLHRLRHATENLRDMVNTALSVTLSLITLQESQVTKRLAAYAAIVAVPTMIAGVYGMNFKHMPELDSVYGYPVALSVMAIIDAYLVYRLRKAKWL